MKNSIVNLKSFLLKKSSTELSYCYNIELSCITKNNVLKTKHKLLNIYLMGFWSCYLQIWNHLKYSNGIVILVIYMSPHTMENFKLAWIIPVQQNMFRSIQAILICYNSLHFCIDILAHSFENNIICWKLFRNVFLLISRQSESDQTL